MAFCCPRHIIVAVKVREEQHEAKSGWRLHQSLRRYAVSVVRSLTSHLIGAFGPHTLVVQLLDLRFLAGGEWEGIP